MNASILKFAISFILCFLAAYTGSLFTPEPGSSWYYTELIRPEWNPPDWLFPPVWSLLFLMMAISLWLVLKKGTIVRMANGSMLADASRSIACFAVREYRV